MKFYSGVQYKELSNCSEFLKNQLSGNYFILTGLKILIRNFHIL
jgi:hypothetical protein